MQFRGHPFVDVGLAIAACLNQKKRLTDTSSDDLCHAIQKLQECMEDLQRLKVLASYWQNNPFMGKNQGKLQEYQKFLTVLAKRKTPAKRGYCQICGASPIFSHANRCWFPLAASADSDPCTLPGLGGKAICADCLRAVILLPLGCMFCKTGPYFFHITDPELQIETVSKAVTGIESQMDAHGSGNAGLKEPKTTLKRRLELLEIVSGSILWDHAQPGHISKIPGNGATIISFTNSGNNPSFYQIHLPAQALEFFKALAQSGTKTTFLEWAQRCETEHFESLCDDIEYRHSLSPMLLRFVRKRERTEKKLSKEELLVLQIYEDVALQKKERFDALKRIADRVNEMDVKYRDSFVKQLGNISSKERFFELLKKFGQRETTGLRISSNELRIIDSSSPKEVINLLYLLCIAEDEDKGENE